MTTEEKAKQIAEFNSMEYVLLENDGGTYNVTSNDECYRSAMYMAEWKEEQMTKNAIDFIVRTLPCTDGFIDEFIKAMKGE